MADVSDPAILEAYNDVRNDKTPTKWLKLSYESDKSNKIVLSQTGSGEDLFAEIRDGLKDDESKAAFIYARVVYSNDQESVREKFLFITWIGPSVGVMRKAKLSVQKSDVKEVIRQFSTEVIADDLADINEGPIVAKLRAAGGANYGPGK